MMTIKQLLTKDYFKRETLEYVIEDEVEREEFVQLHKESICNAYSLFDYIKEFEKKERDKTKSIKCLEGEFTGDLMFYYRKNLFYTIRKEGNVYVLYGKKELGYPEVERCKKLTIVIYQCIFHIMNKSNVI